jgi:hypothetical protein
VLIVVLSAKRNKIGFALFCLVNKGATIRGGLVWLVHVRVLQDMLEMQVLENIGCEVVTVVAMDKVA